MGWLQFGVHASKCRKMLQCQDGGTSVEFFPSSWYFPLVVGCANPEVRSMRTLAVIFMLFCVIVQGLAQRSGRSKPADTSVITHFGNT